MGGKSGGGGKTPVEGKNTAKSGQRYTSIHAIAEGVLAGFGMGDEQPMKSVYLNDTPIQNPDGSFNFKGVEIFAMPGTLDQSNVPGFDTTERAVGVSTEVKNGTPVIRTIVDSTVDALRVTVGVNMNAQTKDNGDTVAASTSMLVELLNKDGTKAAKTVTFTEKSGGMYQWDVVFDELPPVPFSVRVSRVSADSASSRLINNTYFSSYVEIVTAKLSYPHTALLCLKVDSEQFGGQVPRVNVLYKGKLIKVPSNYNPETRTYSSPIWDGSFKEAWTNNPAWWIYDFLTQPRYSGLAKRLNAADVDKWAFYEIAKYCDEPVDDGYGGKEPRFTFNAYMTDERAAADVLNDLASCFRGMAYWNGQQHTATLDRNSDPVALYNNSNVVEGLFTYSGVARKSIHTAVLVQYTDKTNGYRTAIEYVSDDAAVRRYGLNVKNITAFGCDSRGQAYRIGKWLLHTELTQQETISFSVGREGLRHLPNDIVQVLDNDRVGAMVGGRVLAVDGTIVTLDRAIDAVAGNVVGGKLLFKGATGVSVESVIAAQPSSSTLRLQTAPAGMAEMTEWAFIGKVKPVLYRCVAITENTDEGTYTINALLHDPNKEAVVDGSAVFDKEITTLHTIEPQVIDGSLTVSDGGVDFTWGSKITAGAAVFYNVEVWRNNTLYRSFFGLKDPNVRLDNLPNGNYEIRVYAINTGGQKSEPLIKAFSIDYTVTGLRANPQMFAINLVWTLPQTVVSNIHTEVWYATTNNIASATKLASVPYPQSEYTLANVALADRFWFWVRIVDAAGNTGEFTAAVEGVADSNPAELVKVIQKEFTDSELTKDLIALLEGKITDGLLAEANSRTEAINVLRAETSAALLAKASELGTKITNVENVNASQAQQINTVTAAQGATAAGLETEKKARADGDAAEATQRNALAARVTTAEGSIVRNDNLRVTGDQANANAISAMGVRVGSAESGITALQTTVASNQAASATQISSLQASIDNGSSGTNLILNSDFAAGYDGWSMFNWSNTAGLTTGFNLEAGAVNKYNLKDERVFYVRDERTAAAGATYLQALAQNNRARFAVTPGETLQGSVLAAGIAMVSGIEAIHVYFDFFDNNGLLGRVARNITNAKTPATGHLNGMRNDGAYTSLDRFHTLWINEVVPAGAVWGQLSVRFWFNPSVTQRYGFFVRPQVCTVPSLSHGYVPYQVGTHGLSAQVTQASSTVATLGGKVQAMHTLKVETLSGGRKVVAGLALGADGATGDSQVLIYADKFGLVNPSSKAIDVPFAVTTAAGGSAKMALKGDFIATGSILGQHIKASQSITTPILSAPTINAGKINSTAINNGNGNFTVDAAGNLYAKSGSFEGTVRAEKIVGNVLKSFRLQRVSTGVYTLAVPAIEYDSVVTVNIPMYVDGGKSVTGNTSEIQARWSYIEVSINGVKVFLPAVNGIGWTTGSGQFADVYKHYPDTYQRLQWSEVVLKGKTVTISISIKNFADRAAFRDAASTPTVDISPLGN